MFRRAERRSARPGVGPVFILLAALAPAFASGASPPGVSADPLVFPDPSGEAATSFSGGSIDLRNPFFHPLGTNGRACVTCHQPSAGWSITPGFVQALFTMTGGTAPIFRTNDGSNSPRADVSTEAARRAAYSMLLGKGLIRVGMAIPPDAEFSLASVDDPYGYASAKELSLFRRPLPSTNLSFLTGVMWDGRESPSSRSLHDNLMSQATDATLGHAQASGPPSREQLEQIVSFEMGLTTAQSFDNAAGLLLYEGGHGGPQPLSQQEFYVGINDPIGLNPKGTAYDPKAFDLFRMWEDLQADAMDPRAEARQAVVRGEALFNTKKINLTGVGGLNDFLGKPVIGGTCTTCHDAPNVGNHSVPLPINLGLSDASRRTPDLPLYTLVNKATGEIVQTTDPGRALVTGKWRDIGKFKGPVLRGLAARAPYFHNGSAATLEEAVQFYNKRFDIQLTPEEQADLVAFLKTL